MEPIPKLQFWYINHRGEGHTYVIEPQKLDFNGDHWVITGLCLRRDGESRRGHNEEFPTRSFILNDMHHRKEVQI